MGLAQPFVGSRCERGFRGLRLYEALDCGCVGEEQFIFSLLYLRRRYIIAADVVRVAIIFVLLRASPALLFDCSGPLQGLAISGIRKTILAMLRALAAPHGCNILPVIPPLRFGRFREAGGTLFGVDGKMRANWGTG